MQLQMKSAGFAQTRVSAQRRAARFAPRAVASSAPVVEQEKTGAL